MNTKIFLDMDGVLVKCTEGICKAINNDLNSKTIFPNKSRMKKLQKLKEYKGRDVVPITDDFLNSLLEKKDSKLERTQFEKLVQDYTFSPMTKNSKFWISLKPAPHHLFFIEVCKEMVGKENVYILSSPVNDDGHCIAGKKSWLANYTDFPEERIYIRGDKESIPPMFPNHRCILVDDRTKNVTKFELTGGIGIVHSPKVTIKAIEESIRSLKGILGS